MRRSTRVLQAGKVAKKGNKGILPPYSVVPCNLISHSFNPLAFLWGKAKTYYTLTKLFGKGLFKQKQLTESKISEILLTLSKYAEALKAEKLRPFMTTNFAKYFTVNEGMLMEILKDAKEAKLVQAGLIEEGLHTYLQLTLKSKPKGKYYVFVKPIEDAKAEYNLSLIY